MTRGKLTLKVGHDMTASDMESLKNGRNDMLALPLFDLCCLGRISDDLSVERYAEKMTQRSEKRR